MEVQRSRWESLWRPFKSRWILLPSILLLSTGVPFLLRLVRPAGVEATSPGLLWGFYGTATFVALICLCIGVARYRRLRGDE